MMGSEKTISYHTFMLPFIFEEENKNDIVAKWTQSKYNMEYNEQSYFHDFFKKSINSANYYIRDDFKNKSFTLCVSRKYELILENTNLRLFQDEKVGILTLNIKNTKYRDKKSILEINDFTRRLYPEYLDYQKRKSGLVPKYVKFNEIVENFKFDKTLKEPRISKIIEQFLPTNKIKPAVDDRMYTISFYENPTFAQELKSDFTCSDDWYEYIFIDGDGKTVQNSDMQQDLIKKATYTRWQEYGTMYGVSKYSFVCLSGSDFPLSHMQTMYQSMFSLLLMVRATILKFSSEVSDIANNIEEKNTTEKVSDFYKKYIQFINSFYFREVTAKDQGLEIYEKAIGILNIERDIKNLDAEIKELHKYVEIIEEKKSSKSLKFISYLGGALLPVSITISLLGMDHLSVIGQYLPDIVLQNKGLTSIVLVIASALIIPCYLKYKGKK